MKFRLLCHALLATTLVTSGVAAAPATLGLADFTLGTSSTGPAVDLFLGHSVSLDIGGNAGEEILLLLSILPPPLNPPMIGGVPLAVDPATAVVLLNGIGSPAYAIPPSGTFSIPATVPTSIPAGATLYLQAALFTPPAYTVRLTNGLALSTANEPLTTVDQGTQSAHPLATPGGATVIQDATTWKSFWTQHGAWLFPPPPLPAVDFQQHAVVAYFDGIKPTSGYTATITAVTFVGNGLVLDVSATAPGKGCGVLAVITFPYHLVTIPAAVAAKVQQVGVTTTVIDCP